MIFFNILYSVYMIFAVYVALSCVIYLVQDSKSSNVTFFKKILGVGAIYYGVTHTWFLTTYPLNEFGLSGPEGILFIAVVYSLLAFVTGSTFFIFYFLRFVEAQRISPLIKGLIFGGFVASLSYIKSLLLTIVLSAPNTNFDWYWIFGDPSLSFALTPFSDLYTILSLGMIDFLLGFIVYSVVTKQKIVVACSLLFIVGTTMYLDQSYARQEHTSVDMESFVVLPTVHERGATEKILTYPPSPHNIFLIPEKVSFNLIMADEINRAGSSAIYSKRIEVNGISKSSLEYRRSSTSVEVVAEKKFLLPFGEYMPTLFKSLGQIFISTETMNHLISTRNHYSGRGLQEFYIKDEKFVIGLCSDFWSRTGMEYARTSDAEVALAFESNVLFHSNRWFLTNLYAWHVIFAKSAHKDIITVPNGSPAWHVYWRD